MDSNNYDLSDPDVMFGEVRRLLRHLYDPISLRLSPLAQHFGGGSDGAPNSRGNQAMLMRQVLMEAMEALSPGANVPLRSEEWRPYRVVRGRYVEQRTMDSLSEEMGLSERQLRRELREGTMAIAQALAFRLQLGVSAETDESPDDRVAEAVRDLGEVVENVNVCAEIRATERLVTPLALEHGAALYEENLPESVIVQANRVLLRQVLLALYAWSIETLGAGRIDTRIQRLGGITRVVWQCSKHEGTGCRQDELVPAELLEALSAALALDCGQDVCVLSLDLTSTPNVRILLVDDNASLHNLVSRYLVGQPYSLISAHDAVSGLSAARNQLPDIILVDIMMPDRDGWELLRMLKGDPATTEIPVVICSVLDQRALAESLGAAGYLTKPITQGALLELLDSLNLGRSAG